MIIYVINSKPDLHIQERNVYASETVSMCGYCKSSDELLPT